MNIDFGDFNELPEEGMFQDEAQLKREINRLNKKLLKFREEQLKDTEKLLKHQEKALLNNAEFYEGRIEALKEQIREILEEKIELHEMAKLFIKGFEHLRQDHRVVTTSHSYHLRDKEDLMKKIDELTKPKQFGKDLKYRIAEVVTTRTNSHGQAVEVVIVTEHIEKLK